MTAAIGVWRGPCCACNLELAPICRCRSGEALQRTQWDPSIETAIEDWLRGVAFSEPFRTPLQFRQLQFHCGKPPPAAEPRMRISTNHGRNFAAGGAR